MYEDKQPWYFNFVRKDIQPLLPEHAPRVLEVGCGAGATLQWLKQSGQAAHTTGVELSADAAEVARGRVDELMEGPLEQWLPGMADASFDMVLCLDVLEHLVDPWATVRDLYRVVKPGGVVIVSLPNVRNHRVILPLLFKGAWQYEEAGIMDRTHLRFFSESSACELIEQGGFEVRRLAATGIRHGDRDFWKNVLTLGFFSSFFVVQHLIGATRPVLETQTSEVSGLTMARSC